jgi:hypothetical protein
VPAGDPVLEFIGSLYCAAELTDPDTFDHSLQIGPDTYLGPSGRLDDYVNHACDPNCGIVNALEHVLLVAIRPIAAGEEIAYDYSTTMINRTWRLEVCRCGSPRCRGFVGDYVDLPRAVRRRYERLGVVPSYVRSHASRILRRPHPTRLAVQVLA